MLKKAVKLVTNNLGLKLLALLFAGILWLAVVNIDDPTQTTSFTTSVSIENEEALTNMGKFYEIVDGNNSVTFRVSAKRSILRMLSSTDFRVVADMSRIEDMSRVPIDISAVRYTSYVTFPAQTLYLQVNVEDLQTKQLVISADYEGTPAENCAVDTVTLRTSNVLRVSGPQSVVSTIESAHAVINVEGVSNSITDSVVPILLDKDGNQVDTTKLTLNVQTVNIQAEIKDIKSVSVNAVLTGTPKEGYVYTAIRYSPETVRVKGTGAVLNTINTIEIPAGIVDIEGESETIVQTVDVSTYLPDGITLVDDEDKKITVTVEIEQIGTRMLELPTKNITIHNIPEGYRAEFVDETVKVYIRGLDADLEKLSPEDVTATVDVGGRSQGEFTVVINLELDEELYSTNGTQTAMIRLISRNALEDGDEESNGTGDGTDDDDNKKDTENNTGGALNKPENGSNEDTDTGN
jgi:YbbR domain-containing protein